MRARVDPLGFGVLATTRAGVLPVLPAAGGTNNADEPRWRDTMFRVEGDAVLGLQSAVVQNWLEASGEVLEGRDYE